MHVRYIRYVTGRNNIFCFLLFSLSPLIYWQIPKCSIIPISDVIFLQYLVKLQDSGPCSYPMICNWYSGLHHCIIDFALNEMSGTILKGSETLCLSSCFTLKAFLGYSFCMPLFPYPFKILIISGRNEGQVEYAAQSGITTVALSPTNQIFFLNATLQSSLYRYESGVLT